LNHADTGRASDFFNSLLGEYRRDTRVFARLSAFPCVSYVRCPGDVAEFTCEAWFARL